MSPSQPDSESPLAKQRRILNLVRIVTIGYLAAAFSVTALLWVTIASAPAILRLLPALSALMLAPTLLVQWRTAHRRAKELEGSEISDS